VSGFEARQHGEVVRFSVHLQPRASKTEIAGAHGRALRVRVTAPPVGGLANDALIDFLAQELDVSRRNVCIVSGFSSRAKVIEISGVKLETIQRLAG
jgi:uncharacterized protein (TIGR00251 family)